MRSLRHLLVALLAVTGLVLAGCGSDDGAASTDGKQKIAAIFSGPTNDNDYNQLGLLALQAAEKNGATISYSEKVAVPDVEARLTEAVGDGNTVIWTHGSQFYAATAKVAKANPDVNFIAEYDGKVPEEIPNLWTIDRQFHLGFYGLGVLGAKLTKTGTVGYLGGVQLPFAFSEVHAMEQAIKDSGSTAKLAPAFTGDFNDASKAQQFATQLLGQGADVIVGSLNVGATGTFQALEGKPDGMWVTAKYTDKSASAGSHYAASLIYDFVKPLGEVLDKIKGGTKTGAYLLGFDTGVSIKMSDKVPADVQKAVNEAIEKVKTGAVKVALNLDKVG